MIKEPHFTPQRMLTMLGLKPDSLGPYALVPGPKERSEMLLTLMDGPQKNFTFLDYEMHTGTLEGKRVTVGNGGRYAPDTAMTTEIVFAAGHESLIRIRCFSKPSRKPSRSRARLSNICDRSL